MAHGCHSLNQDFAINYISWCKNRAFCHLVQARGASLVERHRVDGDKAKKAAGTKDGGKKSFSWSREEDFEQRRRFTPQASPMCVD